MSRRWSRFYAHATGELPPVDASGLFRSLAEDLTPTPPPMRVHMTAPDALIGRTHHRQLKDFIEQNRDYHFFLWQDSDIDAFMEDHFSGHHIFNMYRKSWHGILRADIFRLAVLYIHGGFYFDLKSRFSGPLSALDPAPHTLYLVSEDNPSDLESELLDRHASGNLIANWFMASLPGTPLIDQILHYIADEFHRFNARLKAHGLARAVWETTGPRMLTRFLVETGFKGNVVIFDHDDPLLRPQYACRGAWVRTLIHQHYTKG